MAPIVTLFLAFFGSALQAQAHMIMANPVPYGYETIDNSPLTSSNYPCKVTSDPATFYSQTGIDNTYAAGSTQSLSFKGSAVHGGGSCQLAITNDMQPSTDTDWRVILSIESGCPTTDGTTPGTYNWTVPEELEPGQYSFAWTWISKLAGQPEYYMNCAPITVTAASSKVKRDPSLVSRANEYPELFVANLDSINSCETVPGTDPVYPDPGSNVEKLLTGATPSFASVTQDGCVPISQTQGSSTLPTATAGGSGGSAAGSATTDAPSSSSSSSSSSATSATENTSSGGVFVTGNQATTAASATTKTTFVTTTSIVPSSTEISVYVSPVVTGSGRVTTTSSATSAVVTTTTASASAVVTGSGSSNTTTSGGASTKSGACTDEGTFNCVGSNYQQCASGAWTAMRALPAGTSCQQGESTGLWARDGRTNNLFRKVRRAQMAAASN